MHFFMDKEPSTLNSKGFSLVVENELLRLVVSVLYEKKFANRQLLIIKFL